MTLTTDEWYSILLSAAADGWIRWDEGCSYRLANRRRLRRGPPRVCGQCIYDLYDVFCNGSGAEATKCVHGRPATVAEVQAWIEGRE